MLKVIIFFLAAQEQLTAQSSLSENKSKDGIDVGLQIEGDGKSWDIINNSYVILKAEETKLKNDYIFYTSFDLGNYQKDRKFILFDHMFNLKLEKQNKLSFNVGKLTVFCIKRPSFNSDDFLNFSTSVEFINWIKENKEQNKIDIKEIEVKANISLLGNPIENYYLHKDKARISIFAEDNKSEFRINSGIQIKFYKIKDREIYLKIKEEEVPVQGTNKKVPIPILIIKLPNDIEQSLIMKYPQEKNSLKLHKMKIANTRFSDLKKIILKEFKGMKFYFEDFKNELMNSAKDKSKTEHKEIFYNKTNQHFYSVSEKFEVLKNPENEFEPKSIEELYETCDKDKKLAFRFSCIPIKFTFSALRSTMTKRMWEEFSSKEFRPKIPAYIKIMKESKPYGHKHLEEKEESIVLEIQTAFSIHDILINFLTGQTIINTKYNCVFWVKDDKTGEIGDKKYTAKIRVPNALSLDLIGREKTSFIFRKFNFPIIIPSLSNVNHKNIDSVKTEINKIFEKSDEIFPFLAIENNKEENNSHNELESEKDGEINEKLGLYMREMQLLED